MFLERSGDEGPLFSLWSALVQNFGTYVQGGGTDCFLQVHLAILWEKNCES